jgi:mercuric reductase
LLIEGEQLAEASPSATVRVGIAWHNACGHAAHSMCREMVFLVNEQTARNWQGEDTEAKSLFTLDEALDFAARFFNPLVR